MLKTYNIDKLKQKSDELYEVFEDYIIVKKTNRKINRFYKVVYDPKIYYYLYRNKPTYEVDKLLTNGKMMAFIGEEYAINCYSLNASIKETKLTDGKMFDDNRIKVEMKSITKRDLNTHCNFAPSFTQGAKRKATDKAIDRGLKKNSLYVFVDITKVGEISLSMVPTYQIFQLYNERKLTKYTEPVKDMFKKNVQEEKKKLTWNTRLTKEKYYNLFFRKNYNKIKWKKSDYYSGDRKARIKEDSCFYNWEKKIESEKDISYNCPL